MSLAIKSTAPGASFSEAPLLLLLKLRTFIALFAVVIFFSFAAHNFLSIENLLIMSRHVALNAFLAIGMTFVIVAGGIDLSVGSVVGLTGMVAGGLILKGIPIGSEYTLFLSVPAVIVVALIVGVLVGAINGLLITRLNVAPFIATLGTLYIARGAALLSSGGETFPNLTGNAAYGTSGFPILGSATILGIPLTVWLLVVVGVIAAYIAARTPLGRQIYAVGANERAAQLSGVRVNRVKMFVYMFSGFCAIISSELVASHPMSGETFELNAIAAAVLGGTSMSGGRGKIGGTIVGAFVIGMLSDGLVMMGVSSFWQTVIKGVVIVAAVVVDQIQRRVQQRFALQKQAATGA
jgi:erythritol transport system permease protein